MTTTNQKKPKSFVGIGSPPPIAKKLLGVAIAIACIGVALIALSFNLFTPIDTLFTAWGMLIGFVIWGVVVLVIRLKSEPIPPFFLAAVFIAGFGPATLCAGLMFFANGAMDPNELASQRVVLNQKYTSGSGTNESNHLEIRDWRKGHEGQMVSFQIFQPDLYQQLQPGDQLIIQASPGMFGWWYKSLKKLPN